ncbi:DUF397 domain-containing protein [Streptomyces caelestis]|uniref:DUF397 domain-containing protein n=1 Tax=Streptomyces caelestis TaxID=36816 RepID=A0A7W9LX18_9ACTN|nr:DUF397 domain-containing protein [Streptomyces caelestis]MBB5799286.1 hypothetical protein [Streptomyces caelestis]GGW46062.1 hypothetical protein GCM10010320_27730 [Streptomyces caelestis]
MSTTRLAWFKSSYSGSSGDDCVEVAVTEQVIFVRDSKDVMRPHFSMDPAGWARFMQHVARG